MIFGAQGCLGLLVSCVFCFRSFLQWIHEKKKKSHETTLQETESSNLLEIKLSLKIYDIIYHILFFSLKESKITFLNLQNETQHSKPALALYVETKYKYCNHLGPIYTLPISSLI